MAALQNYRNIYFNTAAVRVLTANATISGTVSIFYKAQDAIALVPASGVVTVDQGSYTNPTYAWYTVVGETQTLIAGQTTNQYTVTNTDFDTLVGTNNFVTYRVVVTQQGFPSKTLDYVIGLVREVDASLTSGIGISITNDTHAFPSNDQGVVYTYLNSGTEIQVFEGGVELNYDGIGTNNSTYRVTTQAIDIIPGAVTAIASDTPGTNFARFANHSGMPNNKDIAIITYSIIGKTSNGTAFTIKKSQTFTKVKTTALNFLHITPPVLTKQAPDAATVGTYSTLTITGKKYEAGVTTDNIGFVTITKQGDAEVWPALATPQTFTPASNSGASRYVINLYNQATQSGAQRLDDETVDVVFKGATGEGAKVLRIEASSYTFNADAANSIPASVITLTARKQNTTQTVTWTTAPGVTLRQTATAGSAAVTQGDVVYLHSSDFGANTAVRVTAQLTDGVVISDTCNISRVKDGSYAAEPILSNPVHYFPANSAGTVTSYAASGTTLRVFEFGQYRTITAVTVTPTNINSVTLGAGQGVGTSTVTVPDYTSITSDSAQVTYTITYTRGNGTSDQVTAVQAFAKNKQGLPGVSAPLVDLAADSLFFFTPKNGGTITPNSILFSTTTFNITVASRKWLVDGVEQAGQTGSTFSLANFAPGQERLVRVEVTGTVAGGGTITVGDQLTVYSFAEGSDALAVGLENENRTVTCDVAGNPIAGQFPQTSKMVVARGSGIVATGVAYSVLSQTNCVVSIDASGNITISSMSANTAEAVFRATVTTGTQTTNLDKKLTLNKSFNGASAVTIQFDNSAVNIGTSDTGILDYSVTNGNIYVQEGSTYFTYVTGTPAVNQFSISVAASGITAGSVAASTSGTSRAVIGVASNMTAAAVATVTYTITVRRSDGSLSTFTEVQTFSKLTAAQTVSISGYTAFSINAGGALTPSSATLTAALTGINTPVYSWTVTGATPASGTGSSITVTPSNTTGPVTVTLSVTGANMATAKTDTIRMPIAQTGAPGQAGANGTMSAFPSIYQWTSSSTAPSTAALASSNYTWSSGSYTAPSGWSTTPPTNTTPGQYLWEVTVPLTVTATTTTSPLTWSSFTARAIAYTGQNGNQAANPRIYQWTTSTTAPSTVGLASTNYTWSGGTYTAPTGWFTTPPANTTKGSYLWEVLVNITAAAGTTTTAITWAGTTPKIVSYIGSDGAQGGVGPTGPSGAATFLIDRGANNVSTAPTSAELTAAIGRSTPVAGDIATIVYNNNNNNIVYKYTTSWVTQTSYITGSLIVQNTVSGDRLVANTVNGNRIIANTLSADRITSGVANLTSGTFELGAGNTSTILGQSGIGEFQSTSLLWPVIAANTNTSYTLGAIGGIVLGNDARGGIFINSQTSDLTLGWRTQAIFAGGGGPTDSRGAGQFYSFMPLSGNAQNWATPLTGASTTTGPFINSRAIIAQGNSGSQFAQFAGYIPSGQTSPGTLVNTTGITFPTTYTSVDPTDLREYYPIGFTNVLIGNTSGTAGVSGNNIAIEAMFGNFSTYSVTRAYKNATTGYDSSTVTLSVSRRGLMPERTVQIANEDNGIYLENRMVRNAANTGYVYADFVTGGMFSSVRLGNRGTGAAGIFEGYNRSTFTDAGGSNAPGYRRLNQVFLGTDSYAIVIQASDEFGRAYPRRDVYFPGRLDVAGDLYVKGTLRFFTGGHIGFYSKTIVLPQVGDILLDNNIVRVIDASNTLTQLVLSNQINQSNAIGVYIGLVDLRQDTEVNIFEDFNFTEQELENNYVVSINAVGEGIINVCGLAGDIQAGDLIVTSNIPGKGQKQQDDIVRSYTIAKARESVVFNSPTEIKQIACIYLGG